MRALLVLLLSISATAQTVTSIAGAVQNPDGTAVQGKYVIQLTRSTVANTCTGTTQTATFAPVVATLTAGAVSTTLYPSFCLSLGPSRVPLLQPGVAAGHSPTLSATGTQYGTITLIAGTSPAANDVAFYFIPRVTGLSIATQCFIQPLNADAVASSVVITKTGQRVTFQATAALTASTTYTWSWGCAQPYSVTLYDSFNQAIYRAAWLVPIATPADISTVDVSQLP